MENSNVEVGKTLLPALVQCFGIIFIGYILGRTKILGPIQAQGLTIFVQYLSLPALIFVTVSTIPFTQVNWSFVAAIFVSKVGIFVSVTLTTILLTQPHNLGKAAIFAMVSTQSNDFALGYPLFVALYEKIHPEYPMYLYIVAPIQLLILNTVGFFLLEIEKYSQTLTTGFYLWRVIKGTLKNPIVIMTVLGMVWNLTYGERILPILDNILKTFSGAFPATALLLVGHTMALRSEQTSSPISLSIILLTLTKNLILPLIMQKFSALLLQGKSPKEMQSLESFGFLYGTIPTAPSVYVFANQYDTCIDITTKVIIGSTLLSAPLMFATASVISLKEIGIENTAFYLNQTMSYLSSVNLFCSIWLISIFWAGKQWKSTSLNIVFYLILAQLFISVGGILQFFSPECYSVLFYAQYLLTTGSIYATRMSIFLLSALLLTIRIRSLCFILEMKKKINIVSIMVCFIFPYCLAASLLGCQATENDPQFKFGFSQILITFLVTCTCLIGTVTSGILQQIYLKRNIRNAGDRSSINYQAISSDDFNASSTSNIRIRNTCDDFEDIEDIGASLNNPSCSQCIPVPEDLHTMVCDPLYHCSEARRLECSSHISRYMDKNGQIGTGIIDDEHFFKHITILIFFGLAMLISMFVCIWKLLMEAVSGIFIELEFLDVILNYTLGVVCFIMFGLDNKFLKAVISKFKGQNVTFGIFENDRQKDICKQFLVCYFLKCKESIEKTNILNNTEVIFCRTNLAAWLTEEGVTQTNDGTDYYIDCLIKANIIEEFVDKDRCSSGNPLFKFADVDFSVIS